MPKSCRQQARAVRGCPRGANLGNGDKGRFPKGSSLQQMRKTRSACYQDKLDQSCRERERKSAVTFNFGADLPENTLNCLNAVICDPGSRGRLQSC